MFKQRTILVSYLSNTENAINSGPRKFWSFIRRKKGNTRIGGVMSFNDREIPNTQDIANCFGNFFNSVFCPSNPTFNIRDELSSYTLLLSDLTINEMKVSSALKSFKSATTAEVDGIPSFLLIRPL